MLSWDVKAFEAAAKDVNPVDYLLFTADVDYTLVTDWPNTSRFFPIAFS